MPAPADVFRIRTGVLAAIGAHAQRDAPAECCGLLVGTGDLIDEAVPTRNLEPHPSRYEIDPQDHIKIDRRLRGTGRAIVGAYHSHTGTPAVPSPRDLAEAHYPDFVWIIVSLAGAAPDFRAWRMPSGIATEVSLVPEA
jgi:[CysO sulfur-carrier protein]-S-L-cysteine hydrolase